MIVTIDKAGRIVVRKSLRDRYGLESGTELEIEASSDGLRIRACSQEPSFVRKESVLVHHGSSPAQDLDIGDFIGRLRQSRASELLAERE